MTEAQSPLVVTELLPCPFCGEAAYPFNGGTIYRREPWAACYGTLAGHKHEYIAMPVTAWNQRSTPPAESVARVADGEGLVSFDAVMNLVGDYATIADRVELLPRFRTPSPVAADQSVAVGRLREALERIRDHDGVSYRFGDEVREIASTALKDSPNVS